MDTSVVPPPNALADPAKSARLRRPLRQEPSNPETNSDAGAGPSTGGGQSRRNRQRPRREPKSEGDVKDGAQREGRKKDGMRGGHGGEDGPDGKSGSRRPSNRKPKPPAPGDGASGAHTDGGADQGDLSKLPGEQKRRRRAPKFDGGLTDQAKQAASSTKEDDAQQSARYRNLPKEDTLTARLIRELSVSPYQDCIICFNPIHPAQPTWSCSPLMPISAATDDETGRESSRTAETAQCCWATFHLKCIRSWAGKSVKALEDAWRARGENRKGEWRCPGCQSKRTNVPTSYWCFCGSTPDPKPPRLSTPHSCAGPCGRSRTCGHPCPLSCHPGPCPPCQITIQQPCFCGKQVLSFRCANLAPSRAGVSGSPSCGKACGKRLGCGNHTCEAVCHDGPCTPCQVTEKARCYCGKEERELACGEGVEKTSLVVEDGAERRWTGRFQCENNCDRLFDCGIHHCEKPCHVPSPTPAPCTRSPSRVTTCPCGKHTLEPSSAPHFPANTRLVRTACTDLIPTCESTCMKPLEGCSHVCAAKCHLGPCPPCSIVIVRPCRCGQTTRDVRCHEDQRRARGEAEEILCDRPCTALRACGRHQCNRPCCPLASLAIVTKSKGKKKATTLDTDGLADEAGWHECDLVCGKPLSCGNHQCEARDHRSVCPPCLRSSFEEMICHCGRTILEPPIPCGTRINCRYPCNRPPPCGHPKTPHACHEDPVPCPPCPFLTAKPCACSKKIVGNVRCSQEKVSCGTTCGKLLACGFHHCDRLCHGDACGACHAVCGKPRKLCLPAHHPCTDPCHAPASCSEAEPCQATVTITCSCGRIRQPVLCGRSTANPAGREGSQQLKCTNECQIAKRNARLAEALGINPEGRSTQVTYSDEVVAFARANIKFCLLVEKTFADFLSSDKRSQILPHMPESRRKFVHDLAAVYRMDTQMVDQEPHRSVQLFRRIDSRVPTPLLSSTVAQSSTASSSLGRLADLRAPVAQLPRAAAGAARPLPSAATPPPQAPVGGRGWTSVVARPQSAQPSPAPSPTAWLMGGERTSSAVSTQPARPRPAASPAPPAPVVPAPAASAGDVPDNWEDEL